MKHPGKCRFLHGHNYGVTVTIDAAVNPTTGMVMDYSDLKRIVRSVLDKFDHTFVVENGDALLEQLGSELTDRLIVLDCAPTAENLASLWWTCLFGKLDIQFLTVTVKETEATSAICDELREVRVLHEYNV